MQHDDSLIRSATPLDQVSPFRAKREVRSKRPQRRPRHAARNASFPFASASHELRTPLTGILGYAEMLGHTPDLDPTTRDRWTQLIEQNARRLLSLLNGILAASQSESSKAPLRLAPCDPRQLVENTVALLAPLTFNTNVPVIVSCDDDVPDRVLTDQEKLGQILTNLIGNALKFTPAGSVKVHVQTTRTRYGPRLVVRVIDTGIGIGASDLRRVFGRAERGRNAVSRRINGAGLGLWISKRLANVMRATLKLQSQQGRGTTATLSLPLAQADGETGQDTSPLTATPRRAA